MSADGIRRSTLEDVRPANVRTDDTRGNAAEMKKERAVRPQGNPWFRWGGGYDQYADQAHELTLQIPGRFDPDAAGDWSCCIGLRLTPEGGVPERTYALAVADGFIEVTPDLFPEEADLTLEVATGLWAALLLKKKRIETAILQGHIKYDGAVDKVLPLRHAFRI